MLRHAAGNNSLLLLWPVWPYHSWQAGDKEDTVFHSITTAADDEPSVVQVANKYPGDKNKHVTNTGGNNKTADDQRYAGGQGWKRYQPGKAHAKWEAQRTEEFPETGYISYDYPVNGVYA